MPKGIFIDREKLRGAIWGKRDQLAEFLGVDPATVSRKMRAKLPISFDELNKISAFLGRDAMEFIEEKEI